MHWIPTASLTFLTKWLFSLQLPPNMLLQTSSAVQILKKPFTNSQRNTKKKRSPLLCLKKKKIHNKVQHWRQDQGCFKGKCEGNALWNTLGTLVWHDVCCNNDQSDNISRNLFSSKVPMLLGPMFLTKWVQNSVMFPFSVQWSRATARRKRRHWMAMQREHKD